jgi:hypothetical protein
VPRVLQDFVCFARAPVGSEYSNYTAFPLVGQALAVSYNLPGFAATNDTNLVRLPFLCS